MDIQNILEVLKDNKRDIDLDYFSFHTDRFNLLIKNLEENFKIGKSFLDIGSFKGYLMIAASLLGYTVAGTDLNKYIEEIKSLSEKYNFNNLPADLSKDSLPFNDNSFDVIILSEVLEHFNFNPEYIFQEIARVLKKDGIIIVTTPNLVRLNNIVKLIINKSINAELDEVFAEGTHYREYTTDEISYLMEKAGLTVSKISFLNFKYPNLGGLVKISDIFSFFFPKKKRDIYIVGVKK